MKAASKLCEKALDAQTKKELGAYYTPNELTDILSSWAIQEVTDNVLEPSFGGCGFLRSAANRLQELGAHHPQQQLYGCDIDIRAFDYLHDTFHEMVDLQHFKLDNFLNLSEQSWPKFDVLIGNPPYFSYHKIEKELRAQALLTIEKQGLQIDLRSGIWAYFVFLGLGYIKLGGRMAWVLPGSFLHSNYSETVRRQLNSKFERIQAFNIQQRLFLSDDTDEQSVILLADGYREQPCEGNDDIPLEFCADLNELQVSIEAWENGTLSPWSCERFHQKLISKTTAKVLSKITESEFNKKMGDFADVRIGLVAGDKKFLILTASKASENGINKDALTPVISGFKSIKGLYYSKNDYSFDLNNEESSLMVSPDNLEGVDESLSVYLSTYPEEKIESVATFKKRKPWCRVDDKNIPDAFFPVINHFGPKLVLNRIGLNCTNTLYRVYFKNKLTINHQKLMAISLLTTFSQISAECVGRISGSGALKHEPRETEKIQILMPENLTVGVVNSTYNKLDKLLRKGKVDAVRDMADQFILTASNLNIYDSDRQSMVETLHYIRSYRKK